MTAGNDARRISVVIPTFQRRDALKRLLHALERQSVSAETFEVVIAVDGSTDGTVEMLRSLRQPYRLRWVQQPHAGRASACNAAIRRAAGQLVVILDDDMEPTWDFLAAHRRAHPPGSRRCVMGAAPIDVDADAAPHVRYVATKFNEHLTRLAEAEHRFQLRDFYSGNASVRREELIAVGLFDVRFRAYGNEDLELAHRLLANGVRLGFSAGAVARQHYDKSLVSLALDEYSKGRTAVLLAATHPDVLPAMKLAALRSQRPRRRVARRALLWGTRAFRSLPELILGGVRGLERVVPNRLAPVYRFTLEYFYMLGTEREFAGQRSATPSWRER
jgi:GT2 family glycosyltransferase